MMPRCPPVPPKIHIVKPKESEKPSSRQGDIPSKLVVRNAVRSRQDQLRTIRPACKEFDGPNPILAWEEEQAENAPDGSHEVEARPRFVPRGRPPVDPPRAAQRGFVLVDSKKRPADNRSQAPLYPLSSTSTTADSRVVFDNYSANELPRAPPPSIPKEIKIPFSREEEPKQPEMSSPPGPPQAPLLFETHGTQTTRPPTPQPQPLCSMSTGLIRAFSPPLSPPPPIVYECPPRPEKRRKRDILKSAYTMKQKKPKRKPPSKETKQEQGQKKPGSRLPSHSRKSLKDTFKGLGGRLKSKKSLKKDAHFQQEAPAWREICSRSDEEEVELGPYDRNGKRVDVDMHPQYKEREAEREMEWRIRRLNELEFGMLPSDSEDSENSEHSEDLGDWEGSDGVNEFLYRGLIDEWEDEKEAERERQEGKGSRLPMDACINASVAPRSLPSQDLLSTITKRDVKVVDAPLEEEGSDNVALPSSPLAPESFAPREYPATVSKRLEKELHFPDTSPNPLPPLTGQELPQIPNILEVNCDEIFTSAKYKVGSTEERRKARAKEARQAAESKKISAITPEMLLATKVSIQQTARQRRQQLSDEQYLGFWAGPREWNEARWELYYLQCKELLYDFRVATPPPRPHTPPRVLPLASPIPTIKIEAPSDGDVDVTSKCEKSRKNHSARRLYRKALQAYNKQIEAANAAQEAAASLKAFISDVTVSEIDSELRQLAAVARVAEKRLEKMKRTTKMGKKNLNPELRRKYEEGVVTRPVPCRHWDPRLKKKKSKIADKGVEGEGNTNLPVKHSGKGGKEVGKTVNPPSLPRL